MKVVGKAITHDSAAKHVSGEAHYVDDLPELPGTVHIALGLSPVASGDIMSLNLDAVRRAPGVIAVFTTDDIPGHNDVSPFGGDDPMFAATRVDYLGQSLFAVAAENRDLARRAARLAATEIDAQRPILTIDDALSANSTLEPIKTLSQGDAASAIAHAKQQLEGSINIGGQEHFYLEGQAAMAVPGEDRDITIYSSNQHPTEAQHKVAEVLGLQAHDVTVEVRRMGGGFGGKETGGNLPACVAALVASKLGRPAKLVFDRDDDFMITGKRHDMRVTYRVGFDDAGRIEGITFEHFVRCGMSFDLSPAICDRAMMHADNCYFLPHITVTSHRLKTNMQSATAFRGFGGPQGMVGIERVMDEIAHHLSVEPLDVRRANFYGHRDEESKARKSAPYGMLIEDCIIADIVDELVASSDYQARRDEIATWNERNPILKRGIALTPVKFGISFTKTMLNQAGALVHVYSDGSIGLNHGGTEMGQGLFVKVAAVVAEEFGVGLDAVKITATSTGKVPNTSATAASAGADLNGMAARNAAATIKERMTKHFAAAWQCDDSDILFADGEVVGPSQRIPFAEAAEQAWMARISLSSTGFYATPKIAWDGETYQGRPFFYFAYGAAVTESVIDRLTGENRMLRTDILHDVGKSLNPAIDLGQIEGGFIQGAGWLTTEELVWNDDGRLLTHAPSTYKIPACSDRPPVMNIALYDRGVNSEETIYRSKAVGEPPLMLGISALMALSDACATVTSGYPGLDAPATPERVMFACRK